VDAYAETIAYLQGLEVSKGWDLKLERMRAALALRGHPERRFRALHIAGTNGKGSTAAMLEAVLRAAGHRTGLYTSPHLVDFAERIRAGGLAMPHEAIVDLVAELRPALADARIALTHFELATLIGFEWLARVGVDVAVVEVGLGGRLDATNTCEPIGTAITSIGRDHEEFLGHELAGIAREKAGIAKPGVPLVLGPVAPEIEAVIADVAAGVGAPLVSASRDAVLEPTGVFRAPGVVWDGLTIGLPGAFQRDNARTALTLLAALRTTLPVGTDAVRTGLATVSWPGRLADLGGTPRVVVDGAHNPDGVAALVRELPRLAAGRPVTLVFAVMADKAWGGMLEALVAHASRVVATRVGRRGLDPQLVAGALGDRVPVEVLEPARAAIDRARAVTEPEGIVLVAGSLFLVGEAYAAVCAAKPLVAPWQGWNRIGTQARP
jgi:dihydrofolate synthase/folylpolyglutamate synthase